MRFLLDTFEDSVFFFFFSDFSQHVEFPHDVMGVFLLHIDGSPELYRPLS